VCDLGRVDEIGAGKRLGIGDVAICGQDGNETEKIAVRLGQAWGAICP
jgi:hypothetical protein